MIKFEIKSAFVKTWTPESSDAIKYLLPTAPKIAPNAIANLDSNSSVMGNKNIKHEMIYDNIPPKNSFKNNHEPDRDIFNVITKVSVTIGL